MHENRETSLPTARTSGSPAGEGESRTSGTHGGEESDGAVLPMKPSNQATGKSSEAAEVVEGRAPTKENVQKARAVPARDGAAASKPHFLPGNRPKQNSRFMFYRGPIQTIKVGQITVSKWANSD